MRNDWGKDGFNSIGHQFWEDFIDDVAKGYRFEFVGGVGMIRFWDECEEGSIDSQQHSLSFVEALYQLEKVCFDDVLASFEEFNCKVV